MRREARRALSTIAAKGRIVHVVFSTKGLNGGMNTNTLISGVVALVMLAGSMAAALADMPRPPVPELPELVINASQDCYAIGQQIAAREGGTLYNARADTRGGQPVCVVVVVIPGSDGQRPRRAEFMVPR
jgi:hypothetical protein